MSAILLRSVQRKRRTEEEAVYIAGGRKSGEIFLPPPSFLPPSMQGGGGEGTACKQQQQRGTRVFADVASPSPSPLPSSPPRQPGTRIHRRGSHVSICFPCSRCFLFVNFYLCTVHKSADCRFPSQEDGRRGRDGGSHSVSLPQCQ